jgi:hypothetical protein
LAWLDSLCRTRARNGKVEWPNGRQIPGHRPLPLHCEMLPIRK